MNDRQKYPNEHFVRFMARNYYSVPDRSRIRVLDIGSGTGGNSWYLAKEGFPVWALDKNAETMEALKERFAHEKFFRDQVTYLNEDICKLLLPEAFFDVIADINTLCHVEKPPIYSIRDALRKGGKFFCIAPTDDTWRERVGDGKEYTRFSDRADMRETLKPFASVDIGRASYSEGAHNIVSWIVEAQT